MDKKLIGQTYPEGSGQCVRVAMDISDHILPFLTSRNPEKLEILTTINVKLPK